MAAFHQVGKPDFVNAAAPRAQEFVHLVVFEDADRPGFRIQLRRIENDQVFGFCDVAGEREAQRAAVQELGVGEVVGVFEVAHGMHARPLVSEKDVANT